MIIYHDRRRKLSASSFRIIPSVSSIPTRAPTSWDTQCRWQANVCAVKGTGRQQRGLPIGQFARPYPDRVAVFSVRAGDLRPDQRIAIPPGSPVDGVFQVIDAKAAVAGRVTLKLRSVPGGDVVWVTFARNFGVA